MDLKPVGPTRTKRQGEFFFVENLFLAVKLAIIPRKNLAKFGYKPDMNYKSLIIFLCFKVDLKTQYENLTIISIFYSVLGLDV
jgi:hypothetical protein